MRHLSPDTQDYFHGLVNGPNCVPIIVLDWKISATGGFKNIIEMSSEVLGGLWVRKSLTCLMWSVKITVNFSQGHITLKLYLVQF